MLQRELKRLIPQTPERLKPTRLQQLQGNFLLIMHQIRHFALCIKSVISQVRYCNATCESRTRVKRMPPAARPIEQHCNTSRLFATVQLDHRR
jgi:hypothetical protein